MTRKQNKVLKALLMLLVFPECSHSVLSVLSDLERQTCAAQKEGRTNGQIDSAVTFLELLPEPKKWRDFFYPRTEFPRSEIPELLQ